MVKDVPTDTLVLKLEHLLAALEGEAVRRVRNLEVIGDNFKVAWSAQVRRYDRKRLRLAAKMNWLFSLTPASRKEVSDLTRLLDTTHECIRALKSLDHPVNSWDDWFVYLIVCNLQPVTREDWERSLEGSEIFPTLEQLVSSF